MALYRHKQMGYLISAIQLPARDDDNADEFIEWAENNNVNYESGRDQTLILYKKNGDPEEVNPGDFVIRFYGDVGSATPDRFFKLFEEVNE